MLPVVEAGRSCSAYLRERRREGRTQIKKNKMVKWEKMMQVKKSSKCSCWDTCSCKRCYKLVIPTNVAFHRNSMAVTLMLEAESKISLPILESEWNPRLPKFVRMMQTQGRHSHNCDGAGYDGKSSIFCTNEQKNYKLPVCESLANSQLPVYLEERHFQHSNS